MKAFQRLVFLNWPWSSTSKHRGLYISAPSYQICGGTIREFPKMRSRQMILLIEVMENDELNKGSNEESENG